MIKSWQRPGVDGVGAGWTVGPGDVEGHVGEQGQVQLTRPARALKHVVLKQPFYPRL